MKLEIITTKGVLYDKCENAEQLYDNFYFPLLVEFKELQKQNTELKKENFKLQARSDRFINYWNKLKEWLEERKKYYEIIGYVNTKIAFEIVLDKIQEIEGGMNE